jgi:hypothetical protein
MPGGAVALAFAFSRRSDLFVGGDHGGQDFAGESIHLPQQIAPTGRWPGRAVSELDHRLLQEIGEVKIPL